MTMMTQAIVLMVMTMMTMVGKCRDLTGSRPADSAAGIVETEEGQKKKKEQLHSAFEKSRSAKAHTLHNNPPSQHSALVTTSHKSDLATKAAYASYCLSQWTFWQRAGTVGWESWACQADQTVPSSAKQTTTECGEMCPHATRHTFYHTRCRHRESNHRYGCLVEAPILVMPC